MKKIEKIFAAFIVLSLTLSACDAGDEADPGKPKNFRFICDTALQTDVCDNPDTRLLAWTAGGDDDYTGRALEYDIRYSTNPMTAAEFNKSKKLFNEKEPAESGRREMTMLPRFRPGVPISFGMKAIDEVSRESDLVTTGLITLGFINSPLRFVTECNDGADNDGDTLADLADLQCGSAVDGSEQFGPHALAAPMFGKSIAIIGNIDKNSPKDIAVGAPAAISPFSGDTTGSVSLFLALNKSTLISHKGNYIGAAASAKPAAIIFGEADGDLFGQSIGGDFDFDNDGVRDYIVGAPGADKAYIFLGGKSGTLNNLKLKPLTSRPQILKASDVADIVIIGNPGTDFGASVEIIGNINGEKGSEIVVGAPIADKAYIFYGGLRADNSIDSIAVLPLTIDLNGAGWADWTLIGPAGSGFGTVLSAVNDLDNAGKSEFAVGAPNLDTVFVFFGGTQTTRALNLTLAGPQTWTYGIDQFDLAIQGPVGSEFGASIAGIGHPDGSEKHGSLAIGAPNADKVYLLYGGIHGVLMFPTPPNKVHNVELNLADVVFEGELGTRFGEAVSELSDIDASDRGDILIGSPDSIRPAGTQVGGVYVFYSRKDGSGTKLFSDADFVVWGVITGGRFGATVTGLKDQVPNTNLTYKNFEDFLSGAPSADVAYIEF